MPCIARTLLSKDVCLSVCLSPNVILWKQLYQRTFFTSSSRMHVTNHNWSATKQRLHPQSVAEINRHQFCQGTGFDNVGHRLGLATMTQISACKSPFPSAGTAVSLFCAKTVQQRPLLPREVETWMPECGVPHSVRTDHLSRLPVMPPSTFDVNWLQVQPQRLPGCQSQQW